MTIKRRREKRKDKKNLLRIGKIIEQQSNDSNFIFATTISFIVSWNNKINDIQELEHSPQYVYKEKGNFFNVILMIYIVDVIFSLLLPLPLFYVAATTALLVDGTKTDVFSYKRSLPINYVITKIIFLYLHATKVKKRKACKDCMSSSRERNKKRGEIFFSFICVTRLSLFLHLSHYIFHCVTLSLSWDQNTSSSRKKKLWKINDARLD